MLNLDYSRHRSTRRAVDKLIVYLPLDYQLEVGKNKLNRNAKILLFKTETEKSVSVITKTLFISKLQSM